MIILDNGRRIRTLSMGCLLPLALILSGAVGSTDFADQVARVKHSVVGIGTTMPTRRPPSALHGTGFAVGDGTLIVTNAHVIDRNLDVNGLEKLAVFSGTESRSETHLAKVLLKDSKHDLAVLKINRALPALKLRLLDDVREGEIYAFTGFPIGAALGLYPATHRAMVSSITPLARAVGSSRELNPRTIRLLETPKYIYQLDGTAYPGNSGSPLYDMARGEVVAVINQVYVKRTKEQLLSDPSGISYAIPVRYLRPLLRQMEDK